MVKTLTKFNFGFLEVGTVTPKPQLGNKKPRLFRLKSDKAIINRLGFNNFGAKNLNKTFKKIIAINFLLALILVKNKHTKSPIKDYLYLIEYFYDLADYITINISSPNTPELRKIQEAEILEEFIDAVNEQRNLLGKKKFILKNSA